MRTLAPGWHVNVERGPDWLLLSLHCDEPSFANIPDLAELIWPVLEQHFTYRVVLRVEELQILPSALIGQLVMLHKRVVSRGGTMRLCGLSDANQSVLRLARLDDRFPQYATLEEAIRGFRRKPR